MVEERAAPPRATRRAALRALLGLLGLAGAAALDRMLSRAEALPESAHRWASVPLPPGDGVRMSREAIVVRRGARVEVFSPVCPHLGCRIDRMDGDAIACPCHGSRFALDGAVLHGPATRPLRALAHDVSAAGGVVRVRVDG
jgi:nitrite reductase/ring-hydroxylating ferredoxin subunit